MRDGGVTELRKTEFGGVTELRKTEFGGVTEFCVADLACVVLVGNANESPLDVCDVCCVDVQLIVDSEIISEEEGGRGEEEG